MILKKIGETKRRFDFDYTELTAIAEYLEKQEEKGLRLKEIRKHKFIFEKCEPGKARYSADIYNGVFVEDFVKSCKRAGWDFVDIYNDCLYIFRTENINAIDIVTDDKDKYESVKKKAFFNPKYHGLYILILIRILNIPLYLASLGSLEHDSYYNFNSDITRWLDFLTIAMFFSGFAFFMLDIFPWLHEAKKALKNEEKVKYHSLDDVIKKQNSMFVIMAVVVTAVIFAASVIDSGYGRVKIVYWMPLIIYLMMCFSFGNFSVFRVQKDSAKKKQIMALVLILVILVCEPIAAIAYTKSKTPTDYNKAPITYADFGLEDLKTSDESCSEGTIFSQHKRCYVLCNDKNIPEDFSCALKYEVFVSDYPGLRQEYIDAVLSQYNLYGEGNYITVINTKWDSLYKGVLDDGSLSYGGVAVKDNTVIFAPMIELGGQDFFETAYEKLFNE